MYWYQQRFAYKADIMPIAKFEKSWLVKQMGPGNDAKQINDFVHTHDNYNNYSLSTFLFFSAINWSRRRDDLDQQEANLLAHVRQLRKKVVGQMNASRSSNGSAPLITGGAN